MMMSQRFSVRATSSSGTIPSGSGRGIELDRLSANGAPRHEQEEIEREPTHEEQRRRNAGNEECAARPVPERFRYRVPSDRYRHVLGRR